MSKQFCMRCAGAALVRTTGAISLTVMLLAWLMCSAPIRLCAAPVVAPPLPATFYGTVTIAGDSVRVGATVTAWIHGKEVATALTFLHNGVATYQINVPGDDPDTMPVEGGQTGDPIQFQIDGQAASPTALWQVGILAQLDLTSAPTPTPGNLVLQLDAEPSRGSQIRVGEEISYTITLSQTGDGPHTNVIISATLPAAASFLANSAQPTATYLPTATAANGGTLVWHIATLSSGQSFQARFTVRIVSADGNPLALLVTVRSDQRGPSQQTLLHPLDPTDLPEETEPMRYRLSLPILLR